jgi:hypothetical protein
LGDIIRDLGRSGWDAGEALHDHFQRQDMMQLAGGWRRDDMDDEG